MARKQYNYRLAERLNWFEATRTPVNACPLNVSVVPVERIYQNIPEFRTQTRDGRKKDSTGNPITKKGDRPSEYNQRVCCVGNCSASRLSTD